MSLNINDRWRFGDFKQHTSLKLLANVLGIPSPKDDIDGSQVAEEYYREKDLKRIITYCEKDVITHGGSSITTMRQEPLLHSEEIDIQSQ